MQISARNKILATITAINKGMVNTVISLEAPHGTELSSVISNYSVHEMQLKVQESVTAFFKASHVMIATGEVLNISARNKLKGVIAKIEAGAVNSEINVTLLNGDKVVAIITNESAKELDLKDGKEVIVVIKSSDVMIAK